MHQALPVWSWELLCEELALGFCHLSKVTHDIRNWHGLVANRLGGACGAYRYLVTINSATLTPSLKYNALALLFCLVRSNQAWEWAYAWKTCIVHEAMIINTGTDKKFNVFLKVFKIVPYFLKKKLNMFELSCCCVLL
jgi:hypothetical protein